MVEQDEDHAPKLGIIGHGERPIQPSRSQTNLAWDTLLDVSAHGPGPLHERLRRALRAAIRSGRLPAGSALPPSRQLAADLGCSRWVVTEAYAQLSAEGYLQARAGSATRVRWSGARPAEQGPPPQTASGRISFDLRAGWPDLRAFPRERWAAALRSQATRVPFTDLDYPPAGGHLRLRQVLADYLVRCRGAAATAHEVTVTTGVSDGIVRLCAALRGAGITELGVEDPGPPHHRQVIESAGVRPTPLPVDDRGLIVEAVERPGLRAVLLTPAHQVPTGTVLAPARRAALLEWAHRVDGLVIEDDYDAEFRYDRPPVATIQGMEPSRVCLLGSLSKTLAPALRIGWMVCPRRWTELLRRPAALLPAPPTLEQLAFAEFVEAGAYDRHLRAARQRYGVRRKRLLRQLADRLPDCRISGAAAGLHFLLHVGPDVDTEVVVSEARRAGVEIVDLDWYRATPGADNALVIGYGNLDDAGVDQAVSRVAAAVSSGRRPP